MKSGLEDRNNELNLMRDHVRVIIGLNEVRPGRPEQFLLR